MGLGISMSHLIHDDENDTGPTGSGMPSMHY